MKIILTSWMIIIAFTTNLFAITEHDLDGEHLLNLRVNSNDEYCKIVLEISDSPQLTEAFFKRFKSSKKNRYPENFCKNLNNHVRSTTEELIDDVCSNILRNLLEKRESAAQCLFLMIKAGYLFVEHLPRSNDSPFMDMCRQYHFFCRAQDADKSSKFAIYFFAPYFKEKKHNSFINKKFIASSLLNSVCSTNPALCVMLDALYLTTSLDESSNDYLYEKLSQIISDLPNLREQGFDDAALASLWEFLSVLVEEKCMAREEKVIFYKPIVELVKKWLLTPAILPTDEDNHDFKRQLESLLFRTYTAAIRFGNRGLMEDALSYYGPNISENRLRILKQVHHDALLFKRGDYIGQFSK